MKSYLEPIYLVPLSGALVVGLGGTWWGSAPLVPNTWVPGGAMISSTRAVKAGRWGLVEFRNKSKISFFHFEQIC